MARGQEPLALDPEIVAAIQAGAPITREQAIELATFEASQLGMTLQEAMRAHRDQTLPINAIGTDLKYLIDMLFGSDYKAG